MTAETKAWIEAGKRLGADPKAKVPCPQCAHEYLLVTDVVMTTEPRRVERHMICPACQARNSLLMPNAPPPSS